MDTIKDDWRRLTKFEITDDKFFTYWLAAGPFKGKASDDLQTDFFSVASSESDLRPAAVDYYLTSEGTYASWKKIIESHPNKVRFRNSDDLEASFMYTSCQIIADTNDQCRFILNHSGLCKVWINGREVELSTSGIGTKYTGQINFLKGRNYLLLKLQEPGPGDWHFSFRLINRGVQGNKYRYYLASFPNSN